MLALDPDQKFSFTLPEPPPAAGGGGGGGTEFMGRRFSSRFPSSRQLAQIDRLTDDADDPKLAPDEATRKKLILQALEMVEMLPAGDTRPALRFILDIEAGKADATVFTVIEDAAAIAAARALLETSVPTIAEEVKLLANAAAACVTADINLEDATKLELREIVTKALRLWRFSQARALSDLDSGDLLDVVIKVINLSRITENERKKSALQSAAAATRRSALNAHPARA